MMRRFKFRYYEKEEERAVGMKYAEPDITNMEYFFGWAYRNKNLMQFTGLKDKNGKKIYEGDIVKAEVAGPYTSDVKIKMKGEIIYYEPFACFEVKTKECGQPTMSIFDNFEIIGNKYENPELLGDVNECSR